MNELSKWEQDKIREVIAQFGTAVTRHRGPDGELQPESEEFFLIPGGDVHVVPVEDGGEGCRWLIPKTREVTEIMCLAVTNQGEIRDEGGFNVQKARCACGKFKNVTLRYFGSRGHLIDKGVLGE